jgi:hypothetical protein
MGADIADSLYCVNPGKVCDFGRLRDINSDSGHPRVFVEQSAANFLGYKKWNTHKISYDSPLIVCKYKTLLPFETS